MRSRDLIQCCALHHWHLGSFLQFCDIILTTFVWLSHYLTLFGLGWTVGWGCVWGGQKVPALTLNVNNFFNVEAIATKLSGFS